MAFQRALDYSLSPNFLGHNARASCAMKENPPCTSLDNMPFKSLLNLHLILIFSTGFLIKEAHGRLSFAQGSVPSRAPGISTSEQFSQALAMV